MSRQVALIIFYYTSCLPVENFDSESSSHDVVSSILIWKSSGEASSFTGVSGVRASGMATVRETGDDALVARIFGGGGR